MHATMTTGSFPKPSYKHRRAFSRTCPIYIVVSLPKGLSFSPQFSEQNMKCFSGSFWEAFAMHLDVFQAVMYIITKSMRLQAFF